MPLLALIFGVLPALVMIVRWILRPVDAAAKELQHPIQFTILDFLCLFFVMQLFMALTHSFVPVSDTSVMGGNLVWVLDAYGWISFGALWTASVQRLSQAGISHTWHRAAFLALILPVAFFGSIGVPMAALGIVGSLIFGGGPESGSTTALLIGGALVGAAAILLSGWFTRWMVAAARSDDEIGELTRWMVADAGSDDKAEQRRSETPGSQT